MEYDGGLLRQVFGVGADGSDVEVEIGDGGISCRDREVAVRGRRPVKYAQTREQKLVAAR